MIIKRIARGKGFRGVWIALLILAGYLAVGVGIAWATHGDAQFTLDPELWSACFVLGLAGSSAWVFTTEVLMPVFWVIIKALGFILPKLALVLCSAAVMTIILTVVLGIVLAPLDSSAAEVIQFTLNGLPELLALPAIASLFWAFSIDWSD